jgi:SAM-dependent methyltransferase
MRPSYGHSARNEMHRFVPDTARRILEVGCNTGGFGAALKMSRGVEVWGVEPDAKAAAQAAAQLDKVIQSPFTDGIDIPNGYFDALVFNDVLEHMVDPWIALRLATEKLAAGGVVVASIPNLRHIDNLQHILVDADFRYESHGVRDRTHLRFFTRKSARRLFEESGFEILLDQGINASWWSPSVIRRIVFRLLGDKVADTKFQQFAFVARPFAYPVQTSPAGSLTAA